MFFKFGLPYVMNILKKPITFIILLLCFCTFTWLRKTSFGEGGNGSGVVVHTVLTRINEIGKLTIYRLERDDFVKFISSNTNGEKRGELVRQMRGTVDISVDLEKASFDIKASKNQIVINLPSPKAEFAKFENNFGNDKEFVGAYIRSSGKLPKNAEDIVARMGQERLYSSVGKEDMQRAKKQTEKILKYMFMGVNKEVKIVWFDDV